MSSPMKLLIRALIQALKGAGMLATFVTIFQSFICLQRNWLPGSFDHKLLYFVYGLFSGTSVMMENKERRTELMLYVLPKAVESLLKIMVNRKWMITVQHLDVWLTSIAMSLLMVFSPFICFNMYGVDRVYINVSHNVYLPI